jgi:hypothetical protein
MLWEQTVQGSMQDLTVYPAVRLRAPLWALFLTGGKAAEV